MKNTILIVIAILVTLAAQAQTEAFNNVALQPAHGRQVLSFTVPHEQNVRHYRIEASNDGSNYEVVATVPSKGNAVSSTDYSYDVTPFTNAYYRVGKVEMNGRMPYSATVNKTTEQHKEQKSQPSQPVISENIIVKQ